MKITKIEVVYPSYQDSLRAWRPNLWQIITKINTDRKQIIGYGTGGGGNSSLEVIVGHLSELIIGKTINNTEDIQKIFHSPDHDLRSFDRDWKFEVRNIFDTSTAAAFLGSEKLGLASVLSEFLKNMSPLITAFLPTITVSAEIFPST